MNVRLKKYLAIILVFFCVITINPQTVHAADKNPQRETIRVGFFAMDGYHMIDDEGNRSGYGYDFLRMMARYLDVDYEYIGYDKSWSDMQKMLEDGKIDMVTSARKTPEREEKFAFSRPIGSNECMMAVQSNNDSVVLQDYSTYNGLRVGMLNGNSRNADFAEFSEKKGFTYTPVYFELISDMESALQSGQVDAIVSSSLRAAENEWVIETFANEEIYAIVQKDNTELLNQINYAIDQMNAAEGDWKTELFNRYFTSYENKNLEFTEDETEVIRQYSTKEHSLRILCNPTRKPYSYVEKGQVKGILPDYFRKLAANTGVSCKFLACSSREEYLQIQQNNEMYDVAIDIRMDDNRAESLNLGITVPYITIKTAEIVRRDFDGDIKTVATVDQGSISDAENMYAPDAKKLLYENRQDAIQAVKNGKADAAFVQYYTAQEFINNDPNGNLVYTMLDEPNFQYRMIVTSEHSHALAGILTKAIYAMPDRTIADIASRYTSYKLSDMNLKLLLQMHPLVLLNIAIVFLLLFLALVVLSGMIRGKNKKLNCALKTQEEERRILDKMCMDFTAAYYVELNSGTFEVLHLNAGTNTEKLNLKQYEKFKEFVDQYAEHYLYEKDRQEFQNWFSVEYLQEQLSSKERITYHYRSIPNPELHEFFEAQAVKIYRDEAHFYILVGFRHIDEIMENLNYIIAGKVSEKWMCKFVEALK